MDSKGALSVRPARQSRRIAILAGVWLAVVLVLGFWWATIVLDQSRSIAELRQQAGVPHAEAWAEVQRTERMLFWESGTFLLLLLAGGLILRCSIHRSRLWTLASAALCVGLGALVFLRASEWLAVLAVVVRASWRSVATRESRRSPPRRRASTKSTPWLRAVRRVTAGRR